MIVRMAPTDSGRSPHTLPRRESRRNSGPAPIPEVFFQALIAAIVGLVTKRGSPFAAWSVFERGKVNLPLPSVLRFRSST